MEIHGYTESGSISATIDDVLMTVPDDPANRHRKMIAQWQAQGGVIQPYVAPPAPVVTEKTPQQKLAEFLSANPDVLALIGG